MLGKIPHNNKYGTIYQKHFRQLDEVKQTLSRFFQEDSSTCKYFKRYSLSDAVKKLLKRLKLLESILSVEQKQQYDTNLIHTELLQLKEKKDYQQKIKLWEEQNIENLKVIGNLERQTTSILQVNRKLKQKIDQLNKHYQKRIEKLKQELNQEILEYNPQQSDIFMGEILSQAKDYQPYIYEVLQNVTGKKIKDAKLLYRWDLLNKANFHLYIDGYPNLLLVVLTKSGYYLAAFTEDPFVQNASPSKQGIIVSLTNRQCFRSIKRSIIYDAYHIIFGNSELRIGMENKQIFSNFGVENAYYQGTGMSVNTLLGSGNQRTVQIENYQILECFFK